MKALVALVALAFCAGCDDVPHAWSESEIQAIAEDVADDGAYEMVAGVSERIDEMESRIEDLERENSQLESEVASLQSELALVQSY